MRIPCFGEAFSTSLNFSTMSRTWPLVSAAHLGPISAISARRSEGISGSGVIRRGSFPGSRASARRRHLQLEQPPGVVAQQFALVVNRQLKLLDPVHAVLVD